MFHLLGMMSPRRAKMVLLRTRLLQQLPLHCRMKEGALRLLTELDQRVIREAYRGRVGDVI